MMPTTSPNYPCINLLQALRHARTLRDALNESGDSANAVIQHIGYDPAGGKGRSIFAAMNAFSLITRSGERGNVKIMLTQLATDILDTEGSDADYIPLLEQAATAPMVFRVIVSQPGLATDSSADIEAILASSLSFTPAGARNAARTFQETMQFIRNPYRERIGAPSASVRRQRSTVHASCPVFILPSGESVSLTLDLMKERGAAEIALVKAWLNALAEQIGQRPKYIDRAAAADHTTSVAAKRRMRLTDAERERRRERMKALWESGKMKRSTA